LANAVAAWALLPVWGAGVSKKVHAARRAWTEPLRGGATSVPSSQRELVFGLRDVLTTVPAQRRVQGPGPRSSGPLKSELEMLVEGMSSRSLCPLVLLGLHVPRNEVLKSPTLHGPVVKEDSR
jgi:hypothetical protein